MANTEKIQALIAKNSREPADHSLRYDGDGQRFA